MIEKGDMDFRDRSDSRDREDGFSGGRRKTDYSGKRDHRYDQRDKDVSSYGRNDRASNSKHDDREGSEEDRFSKKLSDHAGSTAGRAAKRRETLAKLGYRSKAHLKKIAEWMAKHKVDSLSRVIECGWRKREGCWAAELEDFMDFVTGHRLSIEKRDAMAIAQDFLLDSGARHRDADLLINLDLLADAIIGEEQIQKDRECLEAGRRHLHGHQDLISRVTDLVEEHVTNRGGSVFKLFRSFDADGSSFLSEEELAAGLAALGGDFTRKEVQRVLDAMDENGDGQASYFDFAKLIASTQISTRIDDERHWGFYLFEDLRRKIEQSDQSLVELFVP